MGVKKIQKVMLICPPAVTIKGERKICQLPMGLLYLGSYIEDEYEVKILDAVVEGYHTERQRGGELIVYGLSFMEIRKEIDNFKPDVIGITMQATAFYLNGAGISKMAKYVDKDITVVVGGAFPSSNPDDVIHDKNIDYIITGEGEKSFKQLLKVLEKGVSDAELSAIDGIIYKKSDGEVVAIPKKQYLRNLDEIPLLNFNLVPYNKYFEIHDAHFITQTARATHMITSRGCPNDCMFCTIHDVWGYKFRPRSAENVLAEVDNLVTNYGIKEIHFEDDNFAYDKQRAMDICNGLKKYDLLWVLPNGISIKTLDRELLKLMRESGCYSMALPFESGNTKTLKDIIKKDVDLEHGRKIVAIANELEIETYGFFIVGFPGETIADVEDTLNFSISLGLTGVYLFYATPFPGTKLLKQLKVDKYLPKNFDYTHLTIQRPTFGTKDFTVDELHEKVTSFKKERKAEGYNIL